MKLLVSQNFPPAVGGTCTLYSELYRREPPGACAALAPRHPQAAEFDAGFPHPVERRNFAVRNWTKPLEWIELGLRQLPAIRRWAKRGHREIHCGSPFPEGVAGYAAKKLLGCRYIQWVLGEDIEQFKHFRIEGRVQPRLLLAADRVLACSQHSARLCVEHGVPEDRVRAVLPGVDLSAFAPDPAGAAKVRERFGLGARPTLVTVGRLSKRKGHDMAIEAVALLRERMPDIAYLIVGGSSGSDPQDAEDLRRLVAERGLERQVYFAGEAPNAERSACYTAGDVFLMPNRSIGGNQEGFGQTFLEAAACGRTSIAGNSGGAVEAVLHERTGLVVDGTQPADIAAAAHLLLTNEPLRRRLAEQAQARLAEFSWARVHARFRAALE